MEAGSVTLGALAPEHDRALVVLSSDGELAVGLRERLDRARVVVKDARPKEARSALGSCRPWPWMVVGNLPELASDVQPVLARHPVLVLWLEPLPGGLPRHARGFSRYSALADAVSRALEGAVEGMRLAAGAGVELPGGRISHSASLQALVSAYPAGFHLPLKSFRSATRLLALDAIPLRPRRSPLTGLEELR